MALEQSVLASGQDGKKQGSMIPGDSRSTILLGMTGKRLLRQRQKLPSDIWPPRAKAQERNRSCRFWIRLTLTLPATPRWVHLTCGWKHGHRTAFLLSMEWCWGSRWYPQRRHPCRTLGQLFSTTETLQPAITSIEHWLCATYWKLENELQEQVLRLLRLCTEPHS